MKAGFSGRRGAALLACAACACTLVAHGEEPAAPPDGYAVTAAIGDELSLVVYRRATGSNLDSNGHQKITLADSRFDLVATNLAGAAIHRMLPAAPLRRVTISDPALVVDDAELVSSDAKRRALVDYVGTQLKQPLPHYLVVVSKHRADARLKMADSTTGSGKLVGLGFYIDYDKRMHSSANGDQGRGFIAPYAYVTVSLIDLTTGAVVKTESVDESTTVATARNPNTTDPWEVLTPEQKVNALNNLVKRALDQAIPRLFAPA